MSSFSPHLPHRPRPPAARVGLVLPFATIGLAGSTMAARLFFDWPQTDHTEAPTIAVIVSVTAACALLGRAARDRAGDRVPVPLSAFLLMLVAALAGGVSGGVAGLLAGLAGFENGKDGLLCLVGGCLGLVLSPAFMPALLAVFFVRRRTGKARSGSLMAARERESVWIAVTSAIALPAAALGAISPRSHAGWEMLVSAVAAGVLGLLAMAAVDRYRSVTSLVYRLERIAQPHDLPADTEVDLGIGNERWLTSGQHDGPYRGATRTAHGVYGSIDEVRATLKRGALVSMGLLVACVASLVCAIAAR